MTSNERTTLEQVAAFLSDSEGLRDADVEASLEARGIDVASFAKSIEVTVSEGHQARWRAEMEESKAAVDTHATEVRQKVLSWPMEQVRAFLQKAEDGGFGEPGREWLVACCDKVSGKEPDEDELRTYVADIIVSSDIPDEQLP